jgi:uroporphyrinogen-III synthase
LETALESRGFSVLRSPLIATETLENADLNALKDCAWWVFTSGSAVEAMGRLEGFRFAPSRVAVVGRATARALRVTAGREAALVSPVETAVELARALLQRGERGPFGWPRGEQALMGLRCELESAGCEVREAVVYRTLELPFPQETVDVVVLASPSAVYALPLEVARDARLIALGSSTAAAARDRGFEVVVATEPNLEGVLSALRGLETGHASLVITRLSMRP